MRSGGVLDLRGVTKYYGRGEQRLRALDSVELSVVRGEFLPLVGPSGSGKSTLLNVIGLIDTPDEGSVSLEGKDIGGLSDAALSRVRRKSIGLVFQSFNLIPILTVSENVGYPLVRSGLPAKAQRDRVEFSLEAVGLGGLGRRLPRHLSGGQQQRVAIARALVKRPSLILADEPTANLDSANGRTIIDLLHALCGVEGATVILATHDERIIDMAPRFVRILDGRLEEVAK